MNACWINGDRAEFYRPTYHQTESFRDQDQREAEGSDEDLGPIRRGRPRNRTRKLFGEETRYTSSSVP